VRPFELVAETREAVVLRFPRAEWDGADDQQRGVVVYVPPTAQAENVARQLRGVADALDRTPGRVEARIRE
jgi:hypothetical protein